MDKLNVLLVGINTKYSHTNLAIRYLKKVIEPLDVGVEIYEPTINNHIEEIIRRIYEKKPNLLAFSCYIWNIEFVLKISRSIKEILPSTKIILGGPEVSFEESEFLKENWFIDYIIKGEGEVAFKETVVSMVKQKNLADIPGLMSAEFDNSIAPQLSFEEIPFPYEGEDLTNLSNMIIYYEASRGCPFSCSYCLSSTTTGVRSLNPNRAKKELSLLSKHVKMIKFVDRTFNCNLKTTKEMLMFIKELDTEATFHLEISAHLLTDEILALFKTMPKNRIQLEIGVQTTNPKSIEAIARTTDFEDLRKMVKVINGFENIHQHLDLIAGLPYENYESFKNSFNDVMELKPHKLQLGFLKLLKGSQIRREQEIHEYKFNQFPPYEVLSNKYLSFSELSSLKHIEHLLETYYNSHKFDKAMEFLHGETGDVFKVYEDIYLYFKDNQLLEKNLSHNDLYEILLKFYYNTEAIDKELFQDLIKFDYLSHKRTQSLPSYLGEQSKLKEQVFEFLKDEGNVLKYVPNFVGTRATEIYKRIIVECFKFNPLTNAKGDTYILFNYDMQTGLFDKPQVVEINL